MDQPTDFELWHQAANGSPEAFGLLFDRHATSIYNFCFRRCGDWSVAEDLCASVFLQAWRRRAEVIPDGESLHPWLIGVAINTLRNWNRSTRRAREGVVRAASELTPAPDFADDLVQSLDDQAWASRVLRVFDQLSEEDQELLSMAAWADLSYEQIAGVTEVPVGTVRSRLHRARRRLEELAKQAGHERVDAAPIEPKEPS